MPSGEEEFGSLVHLFLLAGSKSIEIERGVQAIPHPLYQDLSD